MIMRGGQGRGSPRGGGGVETVNCVIIFPVSLLLRVCGSLIIITRLSEINATHRLSVWTGRSGGQKNIERRAKCSVLICCQL